MKAILLICSAAILQVLAATAMAADSAPKVLTKPEVEFLDSLRAVKIGIGEDELRQRFPDLGALRKPDSPGQQHLMFADFPQFTLAGLEWHGSAEFATGKLVRVSVYASARDSEYPGAKTLILPRHEVRKAGLLIAAHFQRRIGSVTERFVPNLDCPSGNPCRLRHTWRTKERELFVEFFTVSSHTSVTVSLADWEESRREQKELYESSWPLKPAPRALLREVAQPR